MAKHTVRQGECISSIADKYGFFPDTLWNHADNAKLKQDRKDPNVLFTSDEVFVPDKEEKTEPGATEQKHRFRKKNVPAYLRLRLIDLNEKPRANLDYLLDIDGDVRSGITDQDGRIDETIPPDAQHAILTVFPPELTRDSGEDEQVYTGPPSAHQPPEEQDSPEEQYELLLGHTDPVDEVSGLQGRLINLGYDLDSITGQYDERTRQAVRAFQARHNREPTGENDASTRQNLERLHGS